MSLKKGTDKKTVSKNISKMVHEGYPQKQAVAASLAQTRRSSSTHKKTETAQAPKKARAASKK